MERIRIGFPVPLSSVYGTEAQEQARCAQIAVEEFNASGGLDGREAEILVRDTKHNSDLTKSIALELIEKEKVQFMVGALSAIDMLTLSQVCSERKMIYNGISVGDGIVSRTHRSRYVFHEGPTAFGTADSIGRYAYCHYGFKAAFLTVNSAFGPDTLRGLLQLGKDIGVEVVANEQHPLGETNYLPYLERIQAARPEVLITANFGLDQFHMLSQFQKMDLRHHTRMVCSTISPVQRMRAGPEVYDGVVGGTGYYWKLEDYFESARRFNQAYFTKYGDPPPSGHGIYGYLGVRSLLACIQREKTLDTEALIYALEGLRFDFCRGPQFYRRMDHQSIQPVIILESKAADEMESPRDIFRVLEVVEFLGERAYHICMDKR